jgi:hypothetical protein
MTYFDTTFDIINSQKNDCVDTIVPFVLPYIAFSSHLYLNVEKVVAFEL